LPINYKSIAGSTILSSEACEVVVGPNAGAIATLEAICSTVATYRRRT
jgi:hypothetical protein